MHRRELTRLKPLDEVAVLSPSAGLPGLFPWVQDLGLERLRTIFELRPIEYPTTREMNSSYLDRARDLHAALKDPNIKAIFTSIGGTDQIGLLKHLDRDVFLTNPKPVFGFSDNTHLLVYLWNLGLPSFYGGAIMTQFAMQQQMDDLTVQSLKRAMFEGGEFELRSPKEFNEIGLDWSNPKNLELPRTHEPNDNAHFDGDSAASGVLWGGCVESLVAQVAANVFLPRDGDLDNSILFLETAEDIPDHWIIEYLLIGFGERGWLDRFSGVLVGRPKAWEFDKQLSGAERTSYREMQRRTVVSAIRKYNKEIPIVQNLDFGHTDPQVLIPMGHLATVDPSSKRVTIVY